MFQRESQRKGEEKGIRKRDEKMERRGNCC
jgi:hypothetical protein